MRLSTGTALVAALAAVLFFWPKDSDAKGNGKKKNGNGASKDAVDRHGTGGSDPHAWALDRYHRSVAILTAAGLDASAAREVSLSGLAHWGVETGEGKYEWNFNVGNITATGGSFYVVKDVGAGKSLKFQAYVDADAGIRAYWSLLEKGYPDALKTLHASPSSDAWIRSLEGSYYGPDLDCQKQSDPHQCAKDKMGAAWSKLRASYASSIPQ